MDTRAMVFVLRRKICAMIEPRKSNNSRAVSGQQQDGAACDEFHKPRHSISGHSRVSTRRAALARRWTVGKARQNPSP